jgi:hypothetical protein
MKCPAEITVTAQPCEFIYLYIFDLKNFQLKKKETNKQWKWFWVVLSTLGENTRPSWTVYRYKVFRKFWREL